MARITVEDCIDKFESRFELVLVASNRARKLHSGDNPTVDKDNDKNTVIALREIAEESINIDDMKNNLVQEYQTVSPQSDEDLSLEYSEIDENDSQNSSEDSSKDKEEILSESSDNNEEVSASKLNEANSDIIENQDPNTSNLEADKD